MYILWVMRISIVILYLIVFHDYIVYKKKDLLRMTLLYMCVFLFFCT